MKIGLSLLSQHKTFLGIKFEHGGYLKMKDNVGPVLVRTLEFQIGFIFGWFTLAFDSGRVVDLKQVNQSLIEDVINGKKIGTHE